MTLKGSDYIELTAVDYDPFADEALARVVPTTEPQREVWLADHLGSEASLAYNQSICLRFFGPLHIDALRQALQDLVQRHEALRATISADGEEFCIAGDMTLGVPLMDSSTLDAAEQETAIAAARLRAVETPFDLERGPLFRAEILKLATDSHILIITVHHIVCDGWSIGVLVRDLAALYALRIGISAESLEAPASFGDYAVAQGVAAGGAESTAAEESGCPSFPGPFLRWIFRSITRARCGGHSPQSVKIPSSMPALYLTYASWLRATVPACSPPCWPDLRLCCSA